MKKVSKISDLIEMELEVNVVNTIEEKINILDDSYGAERDIDADLGGYVLVLETKDDVIEVKESILKDIIAEYVDEIECEGVKQYCLSLFLLSSDYAVIVVATKELMEILVEE
ncbi:hypothetical protein [Clostridium sp.]|uniref:hypothetical protein n=2 Tax=Clostridiaceae TaxID=31979 RepID=UPI0029148D8F|nr:hypothetical protein [Clostridium sp.]MDU7241244.1 hypothetical protein [Clostridium sp.]